MKKLWLNPFFCIVNRTQSGLTLIELMIAMVAASLVLAGAYSLLQTHQSQGHALNSKIDLRNEISLSTKKLQRSITLAGIGLNGSVNLAKEDAVGSDSLIIFTNISGAKSKLHADATSSSTYIYLTSTANFSGAKYIAINEVGAGEVRRIIRIEGSAIIINAPFSRRFPVLTSTVYPVSRECFFTDQSAKTLVRDLAGTRTTVAKNIHNFQVSFRNKSGDPTENQNEVRTVQFSFTGIFPAKEGAITSLIFSSTAIPRNIL